MPVPGADTVKYGGNTSCLFVRADGKNIYFDAGSGLSARRSESEEMLLSEAEQKDEYHLFLSHLHYDHIQGFPFFRPFFDPKATVHIYGAKPDRVENLESALHQFLRPPFMPFDLGAYKAKILIHQLGDSDALELSENLKVTMFPLSHPNGCLAYKIRSDSKTFVYSTDTMDFAGEKRRKYLDFVREADLLVIDAFFDDDEMAGKFDGIDKSGWGHCSWEQAVALAKEADVKRLALFHHLDSRTDDELDVIEQLARAEFEGAFCAVEGSLIDV